MQPLPHVTKVWSTDSPVVMTCCFWGWSQKILWLFPALLDYLFGEKSATMSWGHSSSSVERPICQETLVSHQWPHGKPSWKQMAAEVGRCDVIGILLSGHYHCPSGPQWEPLNCLNFPYLPLWDLFSTHHQVELSAGKSGHDPHPSKSLQ